MDFTSYDPNTIRLKVQKNMDVWRIVMSNLTEEQKGDIIRYTSQKYKCSVDTSTSSANLGSPVSPLLRRSEEKRNVPSPPSPPSRRGMLLLVSK